MNAKLARQYDIVKLYRKLRDDLTAELADEDLLYTPGGDNPPLGVLCRALGEVQKGYVESFKTFKIVFDYKADDPALETSIEALRNWYQTLDGEMEAALESVSDEDVDNRLVFRKEGFHLPPSSTWTSSGKH